MKKSIKERLNDIEYGCKILTDNVYKLQKEVDDLKLKNKDGEKG